MKLLHNFFFILSRFVPDAFIFRYVRNIFLKLAGVKLRVWGCYVKGPYYFDNPRNVTIGNGVFINSGVYFEGNGRIVIGEQCQVGPYVVFATTNHEYPHWDEKVEDIVIGNNVWISSHVTVTPGVVIGSNTVIGAGSVVVNDIADGVYVGVPAREKKNVH